ncbi:hypothetical protein Q3O98_11405 [Ralstonia pseudosolanacearum]|nr:hypothetical protein [Ralstonia pseudosolanacearum]
MTLVCTYPLRNSTDAYREILDAIQELAQGAVVCPTSHFSYGSSHWVTTIDGLSEEDEIAVTLRLDGQCICVECPKDR